MKAVSITDFGEAIAMQCVHTGDVQYIPRYGVWADTGYKLEVIDTGDDLQALLQKHSLTKDDVEDLSSLVQKNS